jgi:anti-sigma B factor antagonist
MTQLDIDQVGGVPIACLREDLDAANAAAVERRLAAAIGPAALSLVVDLSRVRYLDSAGIDMLLRFSDRLDRRRTRLVLVIPACSQLTRLAAIVGLTDAIPTHPSLDEALAAHRSEGQPPRDGQ